MSFVPTLADIKTTLENDAELQAYAQTKWGKPVKVRKVFRKRNEIGLDELPVILITRPSRNAEEALTRRKDNLHTVSIYAGFRQENRELAPDQLLEFEELIESALMVDPSRGGTAADTAFQESVNDEGLFHPVYFQALGFQIKKRH